MKYTIHTLSNVSQSVTLQSNKMFLFTAGALTVFTARIAYVYPRLWKIARGNVDMKTGIRLLGPMAINHYNQEQLRCCGTGSRDNNSYLRGYKFDISSVTQVNNWPLDIDLTEKQKVYQQANRFKDIYIITDSYDSKGDVYTAKYVSNSLPEVMSKTRREVFGVSWLKFTAYVTTGLVMDRLTEVYQEKYLMNCTE